MLKRIGFVKLAVFLLLLKTATVSGRGAFQLDNLQVVGVPRVVTGWPQGSRVYEIQVALTANTTCAYVAGSWDCKGALKLIRDHQSQLPLTFGKPKDWPVGGTFYGFGGTLSFLDLKPGDIISVRGTGFGFNTITNRIQFHALNKLGWVTLVSEVNPPHYSRSYLDVFFSKVATGTAADGGRLQMIGVTNLSSQAIDLSSLLLDFPDLTEKFPSLPERAISIHGQAGKLSDGSILLPLGKGTLAPFGTKVITVYYASRAPFISFIEGSSFNKLKLYSKEK